MIGREVHPFTITERERVARVVEMRFFGSMTVDEVASVLEVSPRTVAVDWDFASARLSRELARD